MRYNLVYSTPSKHASARSLPADSAIIREKIAELKRAKTQVILVFAGPVDPQNLAALMLMQRNGRYALFDWE